jgi:hypothetical protein
VVSLGTSSDRIFSPPGKRSYYATAAKSVLSGRAAPYVGVSYSEWQRTLLFPCGINVVLSPSIDLLGMSDGRRTHLLLNFKEGNRNLTVMAVDVRRPRLGFSFGVSLP